MAYPSDKDIIKLLYNDPLANAEKITGKSYKDDETTSNLGFLMGIHENMVKDKTLKAIGDTVFSMDWLAYCEMIETFGFGLMINDLSPDGGESLRIYYHEKDGILLCTDSFQGNRNAANAYYNWRPNLKPKEEWADPKVAELVNFYQATSSGGMYFPEKDGESTDDPKWEDIVWAGNHDAREGIAFKLKQLREYGKFIPVWTRQPSLWLLGHWETDDKSKYEKIRDDRINRLPTWVQDNIKGE
jgi:hypothetical protein